MGKQGGRGIITATIVAAIITGGFTLVGQIIGSLINRGSICASPVIEDVESPSSTEPMTEDIEYPSSSESITEDNTITTEPENTQLVDDNTLRNANGEIEFVNSHCGSAYIYNDYLDNNKVGNIYNNNTIEGWCVKVLLDKDFFIFYIEPSSRVADNEYNCSARYGVLVNEAEEKYSDKVYTDLISASLTENGDLRIIFNIVDEPPFDLSKSNELVCGLIVDHM